MGVAGKASRYFGWSGGELQWEWAELASPDKELGVKENIPQQIARPVPAASLAVPGRCMTAIGLALQSMHCRFLSFDCQSLGHLNCQHKAKTL